MRNTKNPSRIPAAVIFNITKRFVPVLSGRLPVVVRSMATLMESALEDGEGAMVIANNHLEIICLVTSATGAMSFDAGELVPPSARNRIFVHSETR